MLSWILGQSTPKQDTLSEPVRRDIVAKLIALRPEIDAILAHAGTAGCSLGVIHHGEIIHTDNFGFRDIEKGLEPDGDTVYLICSLSKSITAATVGILVGDGEFDFDTRISDLLAEFSKLEVGGYFKEY